MREKLEKARRTPWCLALWGLIVCGGYVLAFGAAMLERYPAQERVLWTVLAVPAVLIGHELLHAAAARLLCRGRVWIEAARDPMGIPALRTVFPAEAAGWRQAIICLTPFAVLTVAPTVALACGKMVFFLLLVAMINAVGAYFDLMDVAILLTAPRPDTNEPGRDE